MNNEFIHLEKASYGSYIILERDFRIGHAISD